MHPTTGFQDLSAHSIFVIVLISSPFSSPLSSPRPLPVADRAGWAHNAISQAVRLCSLPLPVWERVAVFAPPSMLLARGAGVRAAFLAIPFRQRSFFSFQQFVEDPKLNSSCFGFLLSKTSMIAEPHAYCTFGLIPSQNIIVPISILGF